MSIKLGSTNIILPYSKAYLGNDLVYQKSGGGYEDIEFTSCPFPTSWNAVTIPTEYKSTNDYGEWIVYADSGSPIYPLCNAFDGSDGSRWLSAYKNTTTYEEMGIVLPEKVLVCPKQIYLDCSYIGNSTHPARIIGYINGETEILVDNIFGLSTEATYSIETDKFYSQFALQCTNYNTSQGKRVLEFQITSGTLRKEN